MNNYFTFEGRIRRTHFGLRVLLTAGLSTFILLGFIFIDSSFFRVVLFLPYALVTWLSLATATKRCHDLDRSGWWQLIPFYGFVLLFAEGTRGANRYGPDPKQPGVTSPVNQPYKAASNPVSGSRYQQGSYTGAENGQYAAGANVNVNSSTPQDPGQAGYKKGSLYK